MSNSMKIAAIAGVALLLVVVVVLLFQQKPPPPKKSVTMVEPGTPSVLPKSPAHTPSTVITAERVPGTDTVDPLAKPSQFPAPVPLPEPAAEPAPEPVNLTATASETKPETKPEPAPAAPVVPIAPVAAPTTAPAPTAVPVLAFDTTTKPAPKPPAPESPVMSDAAGRTYKVQAGDTLTSIAQKTLGAESRWHEIAEANPLIDPIKLRIGQVLKLPAPPGAATTAAAHGAAFTPIPGATTQPRDPSGRIIYIVRPQDSLASIAKQYYGTRELWKTIYSANRGVIGSNPDKLEPGTKLLIPPAPQPAR